MVGKTMSHYKILNTLGCGGMATVYEAEDTKTHRPVALKVLLPHFASDPIIRKRFLREARVGMELDHPGIVRVYDVDESNGQPFIAMELAKGKTLAALIEEEKLNLCDCIEIVLKVADVLSVAHSKKIIHRDIKPRNIMILDDIVKVMDFGLARILQTSSLTDKYEIIGTLSYMSPEQTIGDEIDERSDIFSLGVVLYQMLSGGLPFVGEHPGTIIHAILYADPLRMIELGRKIPVEFEQVVFKTLQKRPRDRYQTAAQLKSDLEKLSEILKGKRFELIATKEVFAESPYGMYAAFVSREKEMHLLEKYMYAAVHGESATILVTGEAGIGKSRLIWEFGRKAKQKQIRYMVGRCFMKERALPYQPVSEILNAYFETKGIKESKQLCEFIEKNAPHMTGRIDVIQALLHMKGAAEISLINKEQVWDTVSELINVVSRERPLIIHLDDLHMADKATLDLLEYLCRSTRECKILYVGTYRPEELIDGKHPLLSTVETMRKEGLHTEIKLDRLNKESTRAVINSVFSTAVFPERFTDSVYEESEGNPLFILEALKLLKDQGVLHKTEEGWKLGKVDTIALPKRVTDIISNRLRNLSKEERALIDVASVEGLSFQSDTLTHCLRIPRLKVLRRLQDLESSHHLIQAREKEYYFDHGKIKDVVYENLIPELRMEYHKLIAEHYQKTHDKEDAYAGKLAHHLLQADLKRESLPYFLKAGCYARALFAYEDATQFFNQSAGLAEGLLKEKPTEKLLCIKLEILKARAEMYLSTNMYDAAFADYKEVVQCAKEVNNQKELAYGLLGIGQCSIKKGNYETGFDYFEQVLKLQRKSGDRTGEGRTLQSMAVAYWEGGDVKTAMSLCEKALEISNQTCDKTLRAACLTWFGGINHILGEYGKSNEYCEEALQMFRQNKNRNGEVECLHALAINHSWLGDYKLGLGYAKEVIDICKEIGNRHYECWGYLDQAYIYKDLGEYSTALDLLRRAIEISLEIGSLWNQGRFLMTEALVHMETASYNKILSATAKALEISRQIGDQVTKAGALYRRGYANFGRALYTDACCDFEETTQMLKQMKMKEYLLDKEHYEFRLWLTIGDMTKARTCLDRLKRILHKAATKPWRMNYCVDAGLLAMEKGSHKEAMRHAKEGLNIARTIGHAAGITEGLVLMSKIRFGRKDYATSMQYGQEALNFAEEKGRKRDITDMHLLLANMYLVDNDQDTAENYAKEAAHITQENEMPELLWQSHYILGKISLQKKKHTAARKEFQTAKKVVDTITSGLSKELKQIYQQKTILRQFYKDLKAVGKKTQTKILEK